MIITLLKAAFLAVTSTQGKFVNDTVKFRLNYNDMSQWSMGKGVVTDGLHYLTHFACPKGKCKFDVRVRAVEVEKYVTRALKTMPNPSIGEYVADTQKFNKEKIVNPKNFTNEIEGTASLNLRVILDTEWDDKDLGRHSFTPKVAGKECMGDIDSRLTKEVHVPLNGSWSKWSSAYLTQAGRPHHWYFVMEDCQGNFNRRFTTVTGLTPRVFLPNIKYEYEFKIVTEDGGHLGHEYKSMPFFSLLSGIIVIFIFGIFAYVQRTKKGEVHPIIQVINLSLLCLGSYLLMHAAHLYRYTSDGVGMPILDGFGVIIRCISSLALTVGCYCVALGWSLQVPNMTVPGEAVIALSMCYTFIELILTFAQYKTFSIRYHLHQSQGVLPVVICTFRVILAIVFVFACRGTANREDCSNASIGPFLWKFQWRGVLMITSNMVVIVLVTLSCGAYNHQRYIHILQVIADTAAMVYLGFAFLSSKTSYFKASEMGSSILPMGGIPGGSSRVQSSNIRRRLD